MGLAKFHVEWHDDPQSQGRLTQPGVTMGTIDYMAPEQWENSGEADIRSDIYSLGCTLFFLVTGKTPYGDPAYDTSRKKLMAHVVAPIPSLVENCPDCPRRSGRRVRDDARQRSGERYAEPAEVAAAMAEFADAEELAEVVAAIPTRRRLDCRQPPRSAKPRTGNRQEDKEAGSVGSNLLRRSISRRIARRRFRRNVLLVVVGSLAAASDSGFPGLVGHAARRRALTERDGVDRQLIHRPPRRRSIRNQVAAELALLPGLNGPWWFEETPVADTATT